MKPTTATASNAASVDTDLAEQAQPGRGIPSQDPDPAAQTLLQRKDAEREAQSVLVAGGLVAGAAAGAGIGVVVAGPVGVVVGASIGAVAGALGSAAAGTVVNPQDSGPTKSVPAR